VGQYLKSGASSEAKKLLVVFLFLYDLQGANASFAKKNSSKIKAKVI
jgi:hypothetical protein